MEEAVEYYIDTDQDGVLTRFDQCQNSVVGRAVNRFGCELDSDGDGIYDFNDFCPDTPKGRVVNFLGCQADSDGDGVLDFYDQCPGTPFGTDVDDSVGCTVVDEVLEVVVAPVPVPAINFVISHVVFDTGSYLIRLDQQPILERDADQLRRLTASDYLLVTGFTDSVGDAGRNLQLSWNRAQSVKDYLSSRFNIPAEQIYVLGRGKDSPIASNDTPEGRQENRRIEFEIYSSDQVIPEDARLVIPDEMRGYKRFPSK
jgi:OmpA-OmpF porin, OOP family